MKSALQIQEGKHSRSKHHLHLYLAIEATYLILWVLCERTSGLTKAEALINWKRSLPQQPTLESWALPVQSNSSSAAQSPCSWRGITCDSHGSVTKLNLNDTGIQGTLQNLNFSALPNLLLLNLKFNHLTGTIPESIGLLSKLQFLDLNRNQLRGTVPLSLANLTQLYELDLSQNDLTGTLDPHLFPDDSAQPKTGLIGIKYLLFQDTKITGRVPSEIGNIRGLTTLSLDGSNFYGPIPPSLGNCTHLRELTISDCQLSGNIPPSIARLTHLTDVRFQDNNLNGHVPLEFGNFSSLTVFHLYNNSFIGQLPPQVCKGGKLVNFSAAYNSFTGPIPISLRNCSSLFRVRLQHNQLTGSVDKDFGVYPNLTTIDISYNRLQGNLSRNWGNSKSLQDLLMAGNSLGGNIPGNIFQLKKLVKLDLSSNRLFGAIPRQIGSSYRLNQLNLSNNNLSGSVPTHIRNLSELQYLDLSMNKLRGPIPYQIGDCDDLEALNLSNNNFNGKVPYQIGNLGSLLYFLDLSYNSLSGEIPVDLGKLNKLISLNLSHNNLSGSIPHSLSTMLSLSSMDFSYNRLEGPVPNSGIFNSSMSLDLRSNKDLCGRIQGLRPCSVSIIKPESGSDREKIVKTIVACLVSTLLASLVLVGIFAIRWKRNSRASQQNLLAKREHPFSIWHFNGRIMYEEIIEATENFHDKFCIGEGAFGKVYKMIMSGGEIFAVKKLKCEADDLDIESIKAFKSEINALTETRHRNIVKMYGFCSQRMHTFLVYEYMDRGSLADMLKNEKTASELDWPKRIDIIKDVAQALSYMHHDCNPPIVHRDISSNNVLMSKNLEAHVSDFGASRFLKHDSSTWTSFAGTYGYAAPELAYSMAMTEKCDVFSFGVLAYEVLMGKHPGDLISHIQAFGVQNINLKEILDPRLSPPSGNQILKELDLTVNLALSCLQVNPQSRPTMQIIAHMLKP